MNDKIIEYISQNENVDTREAMTEQLVKSGYSPIDIEAAFQQLDAEGSNLSEGQRSSRRIPLARLSQDAIDRMPSVEEATNDSSIWWDSKKAGFFAYLIGVPIIIALVVLFLGVLNINPNIGFVVGAGMVIGALIGLSSTKPKAPKFYVGATYAIGTILILVIASPFIAFVLALGFLIITGTQISAIYHPFVV